MSYVPINGVRMLAVEVCILVVASVLAYILLRLVPHAVPMPRWWNGVLNSNWQAVVIVIALALVGRAMLLPWIGIPHPRINDEYSYLLMGDTFAHFRLTNPTPPSWQHFETFHVNLLPTYHSKYPVSQGLFLGFGELVFRQPWVGIYLSTAMLCGAICWTLQAFVPPGWALLGGLFAVFRLALFSYWMNSYWGGSVAALAGALALGSATRLFQPSQSHRNRAMLASLFALSLLMLATSRPYEGFAFSIPLLVYFFYKLAGGVMQRQLSLRSTALPFVMIVIAGASMMAYYNKRTTGDPLLLPHLLNERVYSPFPLFLWEQPKPGLTFHDPVFARFYQATKEEYGYEANKTFAGIVAAETARFATDWFFYCGVALSFPMLVGILSIWRQPSRRIVIFVALSTAVAVALCTYTMFHYAAPATIAIYIFAIEGLRYLWEQRSTLEQAFVIAVCATVFVSSLARQTGSAAVNAKFAFPDNREHILEQLRDKPGKQLVLVSYDLDNHYPGEELVHNWAELDAQKVLWARSKGSGNDADLCRIYPDRQFWWAVASNAGYSLAPYDLCKAAK